MTAPPSDTPVAVQERVVPVVSPGPVVPVADFGPTDDIRGWVATGVIALLATVTRFINLGSPTDAGTPIFDEKHYAPQAWQVLHNHGVEDNPGYGLVVHPPVGKQLIAIGEATFGYNGVGWRFTGALLGVITVVLVMRIVRRISRSTLVGAIAGLLVICDGVSFVAARTALLDGYLTFFVVAAFGALIVDRDQVRQRMHVALTQGRAGDTDWGPRLGVRWWRFLAGVLLGLACGTKWSGLYFVVFFGVMSLAFDVAARRQYQVTRPWLGAFRRDLFPTGYALGLIPIAVYLASYAPWFASETAIDRHQVGLTIGRNGVVPLPDAIRSLWYYHAKALQFHEGLTNSAGNYHPWESKPWSWPMSLAARALRHRSAERCRLRRPVVRQGGDAGRHARPVVAGGAGAPLCGVANAGSARLALCRRFDRLLRRVAALVPRHRPADVFLLRGDDGAVPGDGHRADPRRHFVSDRSRRPFAKLSTLSRL